MGDCKIKRRKLQDRDQDSVNQVIPSIQQSQLTAVKSLSDSQNENSIHLKDLIGSQHLVAMWQFNFMIDLGFVLAHLHEEALPRIKAHFVIGDFNGHQTREFRSDIAKLPVSSNMSVAGAKLSNPFATHHTKMMVLFFTENGERSAQVVIHTSNMISHDWGNMCQGVWKSRRAKLKPEGANLKSGNTFEQDLVDYLKEYKLESTNKLIDYFRRFDWSDETAKIVGSVPGTHTNNKWGLKRIAALLDEHKHDFKGDYEGSETDTIVLQGSAIGSLGVTDKWLTPQLVASLDGRCPQTSNNKTPPPTSAIVWPTVENVRQSFDGYDMGVSIHFKNESDTHKRQYTYMRGRMNIWKADSKHRSRAMPHIKTYSRFTRSGKLRWVLLTSANTSKYAWGSVTTTKAAMKSKFSIPSWELGVLLLPQSVGKTFFDLHDSVIPYDWPLTKYGAEDEPWTKNSNHLEKDVNGQPWVVMP